MNIPMIKNRDIVVTSIQSWDIEIGSNCRDIAREFSKNNRVLYVNSPLDRYTRWKKRNQPAVRKRLDILKGRSQDLTMVSPNLWTLYPRTSLESISRLPWDWLFDRVNLVNNRRFAREILSAVERLHFKDFILFNDGNMFRGLHLKELLDPKLSVYYYRDNYMAMDFWRTQGPRIQPLLMKKSDMTLVNSDFLGAEAKKYNPHTYNVGSGFDPVLYDKHRLHTPPPDMVGIPRPIIGYAGAVVKLRLDEEMILKAARVHPDWNIVLVGPEDEAFEQSPLHRMKNVHFLGLKRPEDLPGYINQFDVAINPQIINEITWGNYPRKIDEYLALGKPVVATETEAMQLFAEVAYLAKDHDDFVRLIETALRENSAEKAAAREAYAMSHSWENNIAGIYEVLEKRMNEMEQVPSL